MSGRVDLAIDVASELTVAVEAMAARLSALRLRDNVAESAAFITDNAASAVAAVANGKDVLVMNPMQIASEVREVLQSSGRALPGLIARFNPSIQQVKQSLDEGKLGDQGLLRIHRWEETSTTSDDVLATELDLALWLFARHPTEICGVQRTAYVQAHLGFPGGGMALVDVDSAIPAGNSYYSLSLIGSRGAAYADDHHNMNLVFGTQGTRAARVSQRDVALAGMIENFAQSMIQGGRFSPDWSDTAAAIQVAEQVRHSASHSRVVTGAADG